MICTVAFDSPECFPMHISINYKVIQRSYSPLNTSYMPTPQSYCLSNPVVSAFAAKS